MTAAVDRAALRAIVEARRKQNLTQAALAALAEWPRAKVADVENSRSRLLFGDAVTLCVILGLDLEDLVAGTVEARVLEGERLRRTASTLRAYADSLDVTPDPVDSEPIVCSGMTDGPPVVVFGEAPEGWEPGCPACGRDHCRGHRPGTRAALVLAEHDAGRHDGCDPSGCVEVPGVVYSRPPAVAEFTDPGTDWTVTEPGRDT